MQKIRKQKRRILNTLVENILIFYDPSYIFESFWDYTVLTRSVIRQLYLYNSGYFKLNKVRPYFGIDRAWAILL